MKDRAGKMTDYWDRCFYESDVKKLNRTYVIAVFSMLAPICFLVIIGYAVQAQFGI